MSEWKRPLPTITGESLPYWEACQRGELLIQRCDECREYQFYPRGICANCFTGKVQMGQGQRQRLRLDLHRHPSEPHRRFRRRPLRPRAGGA